jgi:hypothetical protein
VAAHVKLSTLFNYTGCTFDNMTGYLGGCIYTFDNQASLYFDGCSFLSCKAILRTDLDDYGDVDGGAIYAKGDLSISNSTFNDGLARWGSCVGIRPYVSNICIIFVNFSVFSNSVARREGAINQDSRSSSYTYTNCKFLNNIAQGGSDVAVDIYVSTAVDESVFENTCSNSLLTYVRLKMDSADYSQYIEDCDPCTSFPLDEGGVCRSPCVGHEGTCVETCPVGMTTDVVVGACVFQCDVDVTSCPDGMCFIYF